MDWRWIKVKHTFITNETSPRGRVGDDESYELDEVVATDDDGDGDGDVDGDVDGDALGGRIGGKRVISKQRNVNQRSALRLQVKGRTNIAKVTFNLNLCCTPRRAHLGS